MRWRSLTNVATCALHPLVWSLCACNEAPLDLIWADPPLGPWSGGSTSSGGTNGEGSGGIDVGGASGSAGQGGAPPTCDEELQEWYVVRLAGTNMCLQRGVPTLIGRSPAHRTQVSRCADSLEQMWTLRPEEYENKDIFAIRHVETDSNLDIYLGLGADGTIAVLYDPHHIHNQRFYIRSGPLTGTEDEPVGGTRWLASGHVDSKCLTYMPAVARGSEVQIWPCVDEDDVHQRWEIVPVSCPMDAP